MKWGHTFLLAGLTACRTGGPDADPNDYIAFPPEGGVDSSADERGTIEPAGHDGMDAGGGSAAPPPGDDAGPTTLVDVGSPAGNDARSSDVEGGTCSPPMVMVCDPVHNTGCDTLQQCDVDPLQTATPTGACVFAAPAEGGPCLFTYVTESCPAQFTCVDGSCKELCFCDADCPKGQCCSDTSGPAGFTLCRPCP